MGQTNTSDLTRDFAAAVSNFNTIENSNRQIGGATE